MEASKLASLVEGETDEVRASAVRLNHALRRANGGLNLVAMLAGMGFGLGITQLRDPHPRAQLLEWIAVCALLAAGACAESYLVRRSPLRGQSLVIASFGLTIPFLVAGAFVCSSQTNFFFLPAVLGGVVGYLLTGHRTERALWQDGRFLATNHSGTFAAIAAAHAGRASVRKAVLAAAFILLVAIGVTWATLRWWAPAPIDTTYAAFADAWRRGDERTIATFFLEDDNPFHERQDDVVAHLSRLESTNGWADRWPTLTEPEWRTSRSRWSIGDGPMTSHTTYSASCSAGPDDVRTEWEWIDGHWVIIGARLPAVPVSVVMRDFVAAWNARDVERLPPVAGPPEERSRLEQTLRAAPDLPRIESFEARELAGRSAAEVVFLAGDRRISTRWTPSGPTWCLADTTWLEEP